MTTAQKLSKLTDRHSLSFRRLSAMTGIKEKRVVEIWSGNPATKEENHQIEILEKFLCFADRGFDFSEDISFEKSKIKQHHELLKVQLVSLDIDLAEDVLETVKCLEAENQYLGLLYANSNQDETVHKVVRETRKM
jgi:hypothetical protein